MARRAISSAGCRKGDDADAKFPMDHELDGRLRQVGFLPLLLCSFVYLLA